MPARPASASTATAVPQQHQQRRHEDGDRDHFHLVGLDLLAQVFGRAADHQPGDEHGQDGEHEHAVEARAHTAEDHLAELDHHQGHGTTQRHVAVMHRVHCAAAGRGGDGGEEGRGIDAEAHLLAFHAAAGRIDAQRSERRVGLLLRDGGRDHGDHEHQRHRRQHRPSLAQVAHHAAEDEAKRRRDQEDRQHLQEVGDSRRVLVRVGRVGVEEAAAVGADHLDRELRGDWTHGELLGR